MYRILNPMNHNVSLVRNGDGEAAAREWLRTTGFENIDELNKVLKTTATSWTERV